MSHSILLLPGDGIGPEVVAQARRVLERVADLYNLAIELDEANLVGVAIDREGSAYPETTQAKARSAAALLLGDVGGPQWDGLPLTISLICFIPIGSKVCLYSLS
mgnify:CR=1 FL=1